MKMKLLTAVLFVLAVGAQTASAVSFTEHDLGVFYAGQDIDTIDVDGDGHIDVIGSAYASGGGVYWYENDGLGNFTKHNIHTSSSYDYMEIDGGDIDDDGDIDIVVGDRGDGDYDGVVYLYTNDGSESFTRSTVGSGLLDPEKLSIVDVDGDGNEDVIVPNGDYTSTWVGNIRWYQNDGSESFTSRYIDSNQPDAHDAEIGDMNGDGDLDIIGAGNSFGNTSKYIGNGGAPPSFTETYVASGARDIQIINLDGDSDLDFVKLTSYYIFWYENDGSGNFTQHQLAYDSDKLSSADTLTVEDIDGDGDYDFLTAASYGGVSLWINDGSLNLTRSEVTGNISNSTRFAAIADVDGGGDKEIITLSVENGSYYLSWYEVIIDETPPSVSTLSPADGTGNIALDANLVITFDEAVDEESGNISIYKSDDTLIEAIDVTSGQLSGTGTTTITINPTADFIEQTDYYIKIDATAFDDAAENSYGGIADSTTWNFTTGDFTNPTMSTLSPVDDVTDVAIDSNLIITFDETVVTGSGNVTIKTSDTTFEAIDVTSAQVTGSGTTTITINPASDLSNGTDYYVQIDADAFDDSSDNSYAGIADTTTWSFSTVAAAVTTSPPVYGGGGGGGGFSAGTRSSGSSVSVKTFNDIPITDPVYELVSDFYQTGVIQGYADGGFKPDNNVNRAELTKILMEYLYTGMAEGDSCFPDVQDDWYAKYVCYAKNSGVVKGYYSGRFLPGKKVNLVEALKMIFESYGVKIDQAASWETWYDPYYKKAEEMGLLEEMSSVDFDHEITRIETLQIMDGIEKYFETK